MRPRALLVRPSLESSGSAVVDPLASPPPEGAGGATERNFDNLG
jgi:hypothetical protein